MDPNRSSGPGTRTTSRWAAVQLHKRTNVPTTRAGNGRRIESKRPKTSSSFQRLSGSRLSFSSIWIQSARYRLQSKCRPSGALTLNETRAGHSSVAKSSVRSLARASTRRTSCGKFLLLFESPESFRRKILNNIGQKFGLRMLLLERSVREAYSSALGSERSSGRFERFYLTNKTNGARQSDNMQFRTADQWPLTIVYDDRTKHDRTKQSR